MRHLAKFEQLICGILEELADAGSVWEACGCDDDCNVTLVSRPSGKTFRFDVRVRERVTPQTADSLFRRFSSEPLRGGVVRIAFAPVISTRVAEIARQHGVSYLDFAGNCRIVDDKAGLFISRQGIPNASPKHAGGTADLFAPKSSRIVRAMLHEPERGWKITELADHPDVGVSAGLASKVGQALIHGSYAVNRDRLLYLKEPLALFRAWGLRYPGAAGERLFYLRGDTGQIEKMVSEWCERSGIAYALARLSAAWRHAPTVRYSVASLYVAGEVLMARRLESFCAACGAREVESGANLVLLTPFDRSVFVRCASMDGQTTSPLQTVLDLQQMAGRAADAGEAVFEKYLCRAFESVDVEDDA